MVWLYASVWTVRVAHNWQSYGGAAPDFHIDEKAAITFSLQEDHGRARALRALFKEVVRRLKQAGRYEGSKVALMQAYNSKCSSFAADPIFIKLPPIERFQRRQQIRVQQPKRARPRPRPPQRAVERGEGAEISAVPAAFAPGRPARTRKRPMRPLDEDYDY